mgnify:CR=1 FL=1
MVSRTDPCLTSLGRMSFDLTRCRSERLTPNCGRRICGKRQAVVYRSR